MSINRLLRPLLAAGLLYLCLSHLPAAQAQAQDEQPPASDTLISAARFSHLTSDDGLAQNSVEAILQDKQGFMWFGTLDGLSRYDGYRFVTYRNDPDNANSLSENHIRDLYEDPDGMIWIGTEGGGVNKFDPRTDQFTRYLPSQDNPNTIGGDRIFHIFQDTRGTIWFVGGGLTGVNRYDPQTETFTRYPSDPNNPAGFHGSAVWDMYEDPQGRIWLAASNLLAEYDYDTDTFSYYNVPLNDGHREEQLRTLLPDAEGNLWAGGGNALYRFNLQTKNYTLFPEWRSVMNMVEADEDNFWLTTANGLELFDPRTSTVLRTYGNDVFQSDSPSDARKLSLYRDREGVLWMGSEGSGVDFFDPRQLLFTYYRHDPNRLNTISAGNVSAFSPAVDDHLWVGVGKVLERIELPTNQVTHYPLEASIPDFTGSISSVFEDHAGVVWVGVSNFRLLQLDPASGQFTQFPLESQNTRPSPPKTFTDFVEDAQGNLWIGVNQDGLYRLAPNRTDLQYFDQPPPVLQADGKPLPNPPRSPINDLYMDRVGNIWLSTLNGFTRFDPVTGTGERFRATSATTGPDSWMEAMTEDADGIMWVASRDGLIRFDPVTKTARYYTEKDGLPSNFITGILEDAQGNLWLSTKRGLSEFDPVTDSFRNFDASDGLQGNEFIEGSFAQAPDGRMFFGGSNGLNAFYPDQITESTYQPAVVLTEFELFNKTVTPSNDSPLTQAIWSIPGLTLEHDQNIISFEFAALSYSAPRKTRYRYQLEGFEKDWNETDSTRRFVTYTNLPAGNYTLRVQATDDNGAWSESGVSLSLTMLPPWWETTGFRALLALLTVGVVFGGYQWRVRSIAQRNRDLQIEVTKKTFTLHTQTLELQQQGEQLRHAKEAAEAANRAKSAFLASMSHELRSPLNVILGFTQVVHRDNTLAAEARENLGIVLRSGEHLLALINQVLDLSKIEAGHMALNEVDFDLHRLIADVEDMFILIADEKHLQLQFDYPDDLPHYIRTDAVKLRQILINLISNALKFTISGGVTVRIRNLPVATDLPPRITRLEFEVEDTGPGIAASELAGIFEAFSQATAGRQNHEGTGLGLAISRRFIRLMGGEITAKSQVGRGTMFSFQIRYTEASSAESSAYISQRRVIALEPNQQHYRILAVDDKWVNRQLLMKLLGPLGFEIREAENGQEAVEIARLFQPHLIWMDMRMPVMNGIDATRLIKANIQGTAAKIIALTASAFDEEREDILAAGCDDFLRKPFRTEEIFDMINKHLGVRFTYAENQPDTLAKPRVDKQPPEALKAAVLLLPAGLLAQLAESVELGDMQMLDEVIAEIKSHDPVLSEALGQMANRFEYDKLLELVQEVADEPG